MAKIEFNVLSKHVDGALEKLPILFKKDGLKIIDLREADIISIVDNSKIDSVYIWCCKSSKRNYIKFKEKYNYREFMYEGRPTLTGQ